MSIGLQLDSVNTHLPLRERIRVALYGQKRRQSHASALASASPEQLKELNRSLGILTHLTGNRVRYAEHVASLESPEPSNFTSLECLGNQVTDAEAAYNAALKAVYGSEPDVSDLEVEGILRSYLAAKGKTYEPGKAQTFWEIVASKLR